MNSTLKHLAVIMDGNRRWAKQHNLTRAIGHKKGLEAAKKLIVNSIKNKIQYLTIYSLSIENWNRSNAEINTIIGFLIHYLNNEVDDLHKNNIKLQVIGDLTRLNSRLRQKIEYVEKLTQHNTLLKLYVAFSYSGKYEIVEACKNIVKNNVPIDHIDVDVFKTYLYAKDMPDVDLLIRTGKEKRISNFTLWHLAYAELYFIDKYWPDFDEQDLLDAINNFYTRKRNFGK